MAWSCTLADYGDGAAAKLRGEIDPGTPFSGRLMIWLMIAEMRQQARRARAVPTKGVGLAPAPVTPH